MAWYRHKVSGEKCSCVDINKQSAVSTCPICYGTGFVGGYDYLGKSLTHFPQAKRTKILTELGIKLQEEETPWTLDFPLLRERDFLVRKLYLPLSNQLKKAGEPVVRGNYSADEDVLQRINLMEVWRIGDNRVKGENDVDYVEGTDFIMVGGELLLQESENEPELNKRVLRVLGKKPPIFLGTGIQPLNLNAALDAGMTIHIRNKLLW